MWIVAQGVGVHMEVERETKGNEDKLSRVSGKSWPETDVGESFASAAICTCIFVRVLIVGKPSFRSFMR